MPVSRNLCPNPSLGTNATGWTSDGGTYARSTSVGAGLPRTTGFEGTAFDDVYGPHMQVVAGTQYVFSVSFRAIGAQKFDIIPNFHNGAAGGTFISSPITYQVDVPAGTTTRVVLGPYTAPVGALSVQLKFNNIDATGVEINGMRLAPYSGNVTADGTYFDGASAGWAWEGTANNSVSSSRSFSESLTLTDTMSYVQTVSPGSKVDVDTFTMSSAISIAASGPFEDDFTVTDGFLVASLSFDPRRGRVRIDAYTFGPGVTFARVSRRVPGGRYEVIRGGLVPIFNGRFKNIVDDFEYPAGVDVEYLIEGLTDNGLVSQRAIVKRSGAGDKSWIKIVANPRFNLRVNIVKWGKIKRNARNGRFDVIGRDKPVIVSDYFQAREVTVEILTRSNSDTQALDYALSQGIPIFLQMPIGHDLPSLYASVDDYEYGNPKKQDSGHSLFSLPLIEVDAPPPSVIGSVTNYATIWDENGTYDDLLSAFDTYSRLAS